MDALFMRLLLLNVILIASPFTMVGAQVPDTLWNTLPAPAVGVQSGANLGYSVAVDGAYAVAGAPDDDTGAQNAGVAKVFSSTTGAHLWTLPNPSPDQDDEYGYQVAISGSHVVVGSPLDDTGAEHAGSVFVFDVTGATPEVPLLSLNNPTPASGDQYGWAVAISGPLLVVGSPNDDGGMANEGRVYVYDLTSGTPGTPVHIINNPAPAIDDAFGFAVAISGNRVAVGASADDTGAFNAGSVYVYDLSGATPTAPVYTIPNPSPFSLDSFGYSVGISGTLLVASAPFDDAGANDAGVAYVFDLASGTPTTPLHVLNNPAPQNGDSFAWSVGISGTRVVVGDYRDGGAGPHRGKAHVYDLQGAAPTSPLMTLPNPSPSPLSSDYMGFSVGISGPKIIAGAYGSAGTGKAFLFELDSPTPTVAAATVDHPGPAPADYFGSTIAMSGTKMAVGALYADVGATNAGSVTVFDLSKADPRVPLLTLSYPAASGSDLFGSWIAMDGNRIVVGAQDNDSTVVNGGAAYVYDLGSNTPSQPVLTLANPTPAFNDEFGRCVGVSGSLVAVSDPGDDTGVSNAGRVYVFNLAGGTPGVPVWTIANPAPAFDDLFGLALDMSGTRLVIGAKYDDGAANNAGAVYVYELAGPTPTTPIHVLTRPGAASDDRFGSAVALSGGRLVIGADGADDRASNAGMAYLYDLDGMTPTTPVGVFQDPAAALDDGFGGAVDVAAHSVIIGAYGRAGPQVGSGVAMVYNLSGASPMMPAATLTNPSPGLTDFFGNAVAVDGVMAAVGSPYDDTTMLDKGAVYAYAPASGDADSDKDGLPDFWELGYFGTKVGHGPMDDFDKDGWSDLLELAFGLNPTVADRAALQKPVLDGGYLTMTISKRAGVNYEVQSTGAVSGTFSAGSTTILINNPSTLKVRDNFPIGSAFSRYMRTRVEPSP